MTTAYAESLHQDTLRVVRGASDMTPTDKNRSRLGLGPHTEAFRKFIEDQAKINRDPKRPMIGVAVSRYSIWPQFEED
jgi:hypothetical protein